MRRLLAFPIHSPRLTLAVIVAVTVFFGYFAISLRFDSSVENLLPAGDPDKLYYDEVKRVFGDEAITVIGVFAPPDRPLGIFALDVLAVVDRLSEQLAKFDGVRDVISVTTVKGVEMGELGLSAGRLMRSLPQTVEEASEFRDRVLSNPLYVKNLVSADGQAGAISVIFEPMSDDEFLQRGLERQVRELVAAAGDPSWFAITGIPTIKVNSAQLMEGDTRKFTPLSVLVVVVVLIWAFRTVRGVVLPLATVLVGTTWTSGLMVLTNTPVNMGTLVLNPLLMAIGVAYAIHIMSQYYQEVRPDRSKHEIVTATVDHIAVPLTIAALTTLIGFATFIITPIPSIREFGIYSVFGITVIFALSLAILPASLMLLPASQRTSRMDDERGWLTRLLRALGENAVRRSTAVLVTGLILSLLSAWGVTRIVIETDFLRFFSPDDPVRVENARIVSGGESCGGRPECKLAGTQPVYVVIDGPRVEEETPEGTTRVRLAPQSVTKLETLRAMRQLQEFINRQPGVDNTLSLIDYLTVVRRALDPEAAPMPASQSEIDQLLLLIDPTDVQAVVNQDYSRANMIVRTNLSGSEEIAQFVGSVEDCAAGRLKECSESHFPRGVEVRATGTVVLLNRSADALAWGQVTSLWQVFVVLLVLMSILFLSVRVGLLSLVPNAFPIILLFGVMGWSGISLNISTSLIAVLAIGIAIDDTIHYLSTFNTQMRETGDQAQAVRNATRAMGKPMIVTSVALCLGFLVVSLSSFQPVRHFGYLSSLTMAVALIADLFITPAVVMTTKIITLWELLFLKLGPEPQKQIPLFAGLRPFQAKLVVLMGRLESVVQGTYITRRGEMKPELYVLLGGRADVYGAGNNKVIRSMRRGDVVGEMGLVRQQPRSADVIAGEDTEYVVLDTRFLQRMKRRYPRIAATVFLNLTRILSDRLESTTDALAAAARRAAVER